MTNRILHLDLETFGSLDLKTVGVENYVEDPMFDVTVVAWAFDNDKVSSVSWPNTRRLPNHLIAHIENGGEVRAWVKAFEWNVLRRFYRLDVAPEQMVCTMQKALAYGLPGKLLDAGKALNAAVIKDETARRLMLDMSKPRKDGSSWHAQAALGNAAAVLKLDSLAAYCRGDVEAERCIDGMVPDLSSKEAALSVLDAKMNEKGLLVDKLSVMALLKAATIARSNLCMEANKLTSGKVTNPGTESGRVLVWLGDAGLMLPDLTKDTVATALAQGSLDPRVRRLLQIRQALARTSLAKLDAMMAVASSIDGRARNMLQFNGAGRTLRWAGRLIQPQNLPRPVKGLDPAKVIAKAVHGPEDMGLLSADVLHDLSKCLRAMFTAVQGMVLVSVDFSQIEARVLAWLAGQVDVLETFRKGEDVYVLQASKVGSADRQLGKVLVLACGFGMGGSKFLDTAATYGVVLTGYEAQAFVDAWRKGNPRIVSYWYDVEKAVKAAVLRQGVVTTAGRLSFRMTKGVLQMKKPNGEKLNYHNMRFDRDGGLIFDGVNGTTKKWGVERTYGGRLVENAVQSVARDIMAEAMLRVERQFRMVPVLTVHDELVWETYEVSESGLKFLVDGVPPWASGLPVASELHIGFRYGK